MEADINDDYLRPFKSRNWEQAVDNPELVNLLKLYFTGQGLWNPKRPQILSKAVKTRLLSLFSNLSELVKLDFFCCYPYFEYHKNCSQFFMLCTISDLLFEDIDEYVACLAEEFKMKLLDVEIDESVYAKKTKHCEIICANVCNVPRSYKSAMEKITDALNTVRGEVEFERDAAEKIHQLHNANSEDFNIMDEEWMDCDDGLQIGQNNMQWQFPKNGFFENAEEMRMMERRRIVEEVTPPPGNATFHQSMQHNVQTPRNAVFNSQNVQMVQARPTMQGYRNNQNTHVVNPTTAPAPVVYNVDSDDEEIDAANFFVKYSDLPQKPAPPPMEKPLIRNFNNNLIVPQPKARQVQKTLPISQPIHDHYANVIPLPKHPNRDPEPFLSPPKLVKKQISSSQRKMVQEKDEQIARRNAKEEQKKPEANMARIFEIIAQEAENYRLGLEMEAQSYPTLDGDGSRGESFGLLHNTHAKKKAPKKRDYRAEAERRRARGDLVHTRAPGGGFEVLLDGNGDPVCRAPSARSRSQQSSKPQTPPICLGPPPKSLIEKPIIEKPTAVPQPLPLPDGNSNKYTPPPMNNPEITFLGEVPASQANNKIPTVPRRRTIRKSVGPRTKAPPLALEQLRVISAKRVITISKVDAEAISAGKKSLLLRPYIDENGVETYKVVTEDVRKINTGPRKPRSKKTSPALLNPEEIHLGTTEPVVTSVTSAPPPKVTNIKAVLFEKPIVQKTPEVSFSASHQQPIAVTTDDKTELIQHSNPTLNVAHEEVITDNSHADVLENKVDDQVLEDITEDDLFSNMDLGSEFSADGILNDIMQMPMWPENYVDHDQNLDLAVPCNEVVKDEETEQPVEPKLLKIAAPQNQPSVRNTTAMTHYRVTPEEYAYAEKVAPDIFGKPARSPEELEDRYLMIAFMTGRLENPHPDRGNVFSVRLSKKTETVIYKRSETRKVIELHFEMNFDEMVWARIRKTTTHKHGKVIETIDYLNVLDNYDSRQNNL